MDTKLGTAADIVKVEHAEVIGAKGGDSNPHGFTRQILSLFFARAPTRTQEHDITESMYCRFTESITEQESAANYKTNSHQNSHQPMLSEASRLAAAEQLTLNLRGRQCTLAHQNALPSKRKDLAVRICASDCTRMHCIPKPTDTRTDNEPE